MRKEIFPHLVNLMPPGKKNSNGRGSKLRGNINKNIFNRNRKFILKNE